jgi:plastocyanin
MKFEIGVSLMRNVALKPALIAVLTLATTAFAQSPLTGTWKFNEAKSKITGDSVHFAPAADGAVKFSNAYGNYTFKFDGAPVTTSMGATAQWTKVDENTWQVVLKKGSTPLGTDTYKLSPDGKSLEWSSEGTKPNGDTFKDTATYKRTAGTKGFYGSWRSTKTSVSSASGYEIKDNGDGTVTWTLPDMKASATLKTDGTEAAATGPTVPDDLTLSLTKTGPHTFTLVEKIKGKPIFKGTESISADGKTLTETGSPVGVNEPTTAVYDKIG